MSWVALLYAALTALCLSLNRHHRDVFAGRTTRLGPLALRTLGFAGLCLSLGLCLAGNATGPAWVMWFCAFAGLGYALIWALAYVPRAVPVSGVLALGLVVGGFY